MRLVLLTGVALVAGIRPAMAFEDDRERFSPPYLIEPSYPFADWGGSKDASGLISKCSSTAPSLRPVQTAIRTAQPSRYRRSPLGRR